VVDTLGLLLVVVVHSAAIQERDGARRVLRELVGWFPRLLTIFADGSYAGRLEAFAAGLGGWLLAIVRKRPAARMFFAASETRWSSRWARSCWVPAPPRINTTRFADHRFLIPLRSSLTILCLIAWNARENS